MAEQAMRATLDFSADSCLSLLDFECLLVCSFGIVVVIYKVLFLFMAFLGCCGLVGSLQTRCATTKSLRRYGFLVPPTPRPQIVMGNIQNKKKQNEYIHLCVSIVQLLWPFHEEGGHRGSCCKIVIKNKIMM